MGPRNQGVYSTAAAARQNDSLNQNKMQTGRGNNLASSSDNFTNRFRQNIYENRRKVNQALTQILSHDAKHQRTRQ